jgi:hypothetical protein
MNNNEKFIAFILAIGIMFLILGFASIARATPSGGYGQPFYTKTQQGKTIVYGRATCKSTGAVAFAVSASGAQSIIMRNAGPSTVYICPADSADCVSTAGSSTNPGYLAGMFLKADDALVLDKATTVTSGWKCWASTDTPLNFFAEQ